MKNLKLLLATTAILSAGAMAANATDNLTLSVGVKLQKASEISLVGEIDKVDFGTLTVVPSELPAAGGTAEIKATGLDLSAGLNHTNGTVTTPKVCTGWKDQNEVIEGAGLVFVNSSVSIGSDMTFTPSIIKEENVDEIDLNDPEAMEQWEQAGYGRNPSSKTCYTIGGKLENIPAVNEEALGTFTVTAIYAELQE